MRFDIFAIGQYAENYAAHDWDGEGECPQYWKQKGSTTELVHADVSLEDLPAHLESAKAVIATGSLNERSDYSSSSYSDTILMPAGASRELRSAIELRVSVRDLKVYFFTITDEDVATYTRWFRYFGEESVLELEEM